MADTTPTPVSVRKAVWLCALLIFSPSRFKAEEEGDIALRSARTVAAPKPSNDQIVRGALLASLLLVLASASLGYAGAMAMQALGYCFSSRSISWMQIVGASVLLWGTLFIRGYEITTWSGVNYSERANQWIYRGMYCVGTSIAAFSLAVQQCKW